MHIEKDRIIKNWSAKTAGLALGLGGIFGGGVAADSALDGHYVEAAQVAIGAVTLEAGAAAMILAPKASEKKKAQFEEINKSLEERSVLLEQFESAIKERGEIISPNIG